MFSSQILQNAEFNIVGHRQPLRSDDKLESDDRSASSLALESGRIRLCELHSRSCISKVEKDRLSLTTPVSGMKALAQIGAWHNSLYRMPAVILYISSVKLLFFITIPECMTLLKKVSVILFVTLNDQTAQTEKNS